MFLKAGSADRFFVFLCFSFCNFWILFSMDSQWCFVFAWESEVTTYWRLILKKNIWTRISYLQSLTSRRRWRAPTPRRNWWKVWRIDFYTPQELGQKVRMKLRWFLGPFISRYTHIKMIWSSALNYWSQLMYSILLPLLPARLCLNACGCTQGSTLLPAIWSPCSPVMNQ